MALRPAEIETIVAMRKSAGQFFQALPVEVLREVITVTKVVGSVRTIYRGSVGSLIALGVLTPPEA